MKQQSVTFNGTVYALDRHGFLDPAEQWDEAFAEGMAKRLGIHGGLTEAHWKFIRYLRGKLLWEKTVPVVVEACAENKLRLNQLRFLFPTGYHRGACKVAGINFAFMCEANLWLTYETPPAIGAEHEVDELGFLKDVRTWNERFAHWVVRDWSLSQGLTSRHWRIIRYLRDFYGRTGTIPTIYELCRANRLGLGEFGKLFPEGYRRGACRAAGLPFFA